MDSIDHVMSDDGCLDACGGLRIARGLRMSMKSMKQWSEEEERERAVSTMRRMMVSDSRRRRVTKRDKGAYETTIQGHSTTPCKGKVTNRE